MSIADVPSVFPPPEDAVHLAEGVAVGPSLYGDEHPTWWHFCMARPWGYQWGPSGTPQHRVRSQDPLTLEGSLLCTECGLHGFIIRGRWFEA